MSWPGRHTCLTASAGITLSMVWRRSDHQPGARAWSVVVAALFVTVLSTAQAASPAWRVGVIVSASAGSTLGAQQAALARASEVELATAGIFGAPFVIDVRDDAGDVRRAVAMAEALIDAGALALVCCTSPAASEQVAQLAERRAVPLLSLDGALNTDAVWTLALRPDARTQLTALAVHVGQLGLASLSLMTPSNAFGDANEQAYLRALADAGRNDAGIVRYDPGASTLVPEALWAATRVPGAVVIWGATADTELALRGLRSRGWFGPAAVRSEVVPAGVWTRITVSATPAATTSRTDAWSNVWSAAAPVSVATLLPEAHPNRVAAMASATQLEAAVGVVAPQRRAELAILSDALQLVRRAFEQVAALGLGDVLTTERARQAVLDALVSAPDQALAAGTYGLRGADRRLARWQGVVVVRVE